MRKLGKFIYTLFCYIVIVPVAWACLAIYGLWLVATGKAKLDWRGQWKKVWRQATPYCLGYFIGMATVEFGKMVLHYYGLR